MKIYEHMYTYIYVGVRLIPARQRQSRKFRWVRPWPKPKAPIGKQDEILEILGPAQQPMRILPRWLKWTRWSKWRKKRFQRGICQAIARLL